MNCFNGSRFLDDSLRSIKEQKYKNWELVFYDNNSTDNSYEILSKNNIKNLIYFKSNENYSLGKARSEALKLCSGDWVAFLDTDDIWLPNKLSIQMKIISNTDYIFCYAGINEINEEGHFIREVLPAYESGDHFEKQLSQFDINMVTPIIKKSILDNFKLDFNHYVEASEEYNLFTRLATKGKFCTINKVLGSWRIYKNSLTDRTIMFWAKDRFNTLQQIVSENPGIDNRFKDSFNSAYARGYYYESRYFRSKKSYILGLISIYKASCKKKKYSFFFLIWILPFLWEILHCNLIKRRIITKIDYIKK